MKEGYFFGIQDKQVGPLNRDAITQHIQDGTITSNTLAWCPGMNDWKPVQDIPELMGAFGDLLGKHVQPPPLPQDQTRTAPPPLTDARTSAPDGAGQKTQGSLNDKAYRFVAWCYRPWKGRPSPLRVYVDKDPQKRALPVAVGTLVAIALILMLVISSIVPTEDSGPGPQQPTQAGQPTAPMAPMAPMAPDPGWRERHRALMDAQRFGQDISQRAYEYRRDSGDRRDETYRRGTYDWYRDRK